MLTSTPQKPKRRDHGTRPSDRTLPKDALQGVRPREIPRRNVQKKRRFLQQMQTLHLPATTQDCRRALRQGPRRPRRKPCLEQVLLTPPSNPTSAGYATSPARHTSSPGSKAKLLAFAHPASANATASQASKSPSAPTADTTGATETAKKSKRRGEDAKGDGKYAIQGIGNRLNSSPNAPKRPKSRNSRIRKNASSYEAV